MRSYKNIQILYADNYLKTLGLSEYGTRDFKLLIKSKTENEYLSLVAYLIDYIIDFKAEIKNNETIAYHSWVLKFVAESESLYNLHEVRNSIANFEEGVDNAITTVKNQEKECAKHNAIARFPIFGQKLAISDGVLEKLNVEGVRYSAPNHMAGWYLTTDLYDGNVSSLKVIDYYELAFKRPDLVKFLALPFGYRFNSGSAEIWYDENVVDSE